MWKTNIARTLTAQQRINDALIKYMEHTNNQFDQLKMRVAVLEAEVHQLKKLGR